MLKHHHNVLHAERETHAGSRGRPPRAAMATLLLVAWVSFAAFVALYRAPLPADAFTALAVQLTHRADMARTA